MNFFDAHCDTLYELFKTKESLAKNNLHIDLERISQYDAYTQFFAIWIENETNAFEKFAAMADIFEGEIQKNSDRIEKCLSFGDALSARRQNKCAAFLTLEGAYMVNSSDDIDLLHDMNIRCIALTWNGENKLAGGANSKQGLTKLGKACIKRMEELGVLVDVSHLNEGSFWEVAKAAKGPIIASHSNAKALCRHKRNLTDEQFAAICKSGGCVGVSFYDEFLSDDKAANLDTWVAHVKHFLSLGGENHIGIGSDFDGIKSMCNELKGVQDMSRVEQALLSAGINEKIVDKITHKNFEKVLEYIR